jgi:protoporphyrinogen oxidase
MRRVDILVLGAGPTGMGAALRLNEQSDASWLVIEASDVVGGAAGSWRDEKGFLWDMGGHVIHSHFPYFDAVIHDAVSEWSYPTRNGAVWVGDHFMDAPIQQHLDQLNPALETTIRAELAELAQHPAAPSNTLADWFRGEFGASLTDTFFEPFNFKMWAYPPLQMDHSWTSLRSGSGVRNVPKVDAATKTTVEKFPYPRHGTGSMWAAILDRLPKDKFLMGLRVVAVDLEKHNVTLSSGEQIEYGTCISSIPLPELLQDIDKHPELTKQVRALHHSAVEVVGLGFEGIAPSSIANRSWIYTADSDIALHRATILSNYSDLVAGPGRWSILCEIGVSEFRPVDRAGLVDNCLATLKRWGVETEPVSIAQRFVPYGYPVPTLDRDSILEPLHAELERNGVRSRGRFGGWRYESCNQDYSLMQGVEAVDAIITHSDEAVFWHPEQF